jgi:hypothetical protein
MFVNVITTPLPDLYLVEITVITAIIGQKQKAVNYKL